MTAKNQDPSLPVDLASDEEAVANWMQGMPRAQAPALMRARVLDSVDDTSGREVQLSRQVRMGRHVRLSMGRFGARRLGLAAAAVLALALGTGWMIQRTGTGTVFPGSEILASGDSLPTGSATLSDVVIDEELGLLHGLETFDLVGMDRSELIADW